VGVALLGWQRKCFTYVSVTPVRDESGLAKLNLHPDDWRDPADRGPYLEALAAEVLTGDPISFSALLEIPADLHPRALLSTSMALSPGLRARLEGRFGCPVLDLYSMNEAGPLAVADAQAGGHVLLQHRMYVEILDPRGRPRPEGERGEVTLTGGFNFCLPLLRYRTGDFASLSFAEPEPVLVDLQGRPPVRFRTMAGAWINNLEVTHTLAPLALTQFTLHQEATGALRLRWCGENAGAAIEKSLRSLFGDAQEMRLEQGPLWEQKVVQYTSELAGAEP
jgi:phenylacetate-CoA ligase